MAVFKLTDILVLGPSAFLTAWLSVHLALGTRALVGLKCYIPVPGSAGDAAQVNASQKKKKGGSDRGTQTVKEEDVLEHSQCMVYPLSLATHPYPILKMPEYANLESLAYSTLLMVVVSVMYGVACYTGMIPVFSTAALLLSASVFLMSLVALFVVGLMSPTSTGEDRVYAMIYSCAGFFVAVAFFASEPKGLFTWSPGAGAGAASSLLTTIIERAFDKELEIEIDAPMSLLGIAFAIIAACLTSVLHASILRFARAYHAHMSPARWMEMYMERDVLDSMRLQLQMIAPIALVLLYVRVVVFDLLHVDETRLVVLRSVGLICTGLLFLSNSRILIKRYLELPLITWYTKKNENLAGKRKAERAAAWAVVSTLANVVAATAGKVAMMAVAPGIMYLSCGILSAGAAAYSMTKGDDVGRYSAAFVENSVGFVVTYVGGMWIVVAGASLWLLRTGTVRY